ncbi:MAG: hypothetical protein ACPGWR_03790 [Ardenticatenaceae bacterium]
MARFLTLLTSTSEQPFPDSPYLIAADDISAVSAAAARVVLRFGSLPHLIAADDIYGATFAIW